jgi:hypothetical protein
MPTEDDIPEVGIQYDVQRVVSSLPLPLGKKILENFQGWDTRRGVYRLTCREAPRSRPPLYLTFIVPCGADR